MRAQARWVHSSARKARLVTDLIRGRSVPEARTILAFSNRAVAKDVDKVLRSAVANAESRPDLHWHGDDLVIVAAHADEGPTLKRWRARARGRVARIKKRTCHITVTLVPAEVPAAAPARSAKAAPAPAAQPTAEAAAEETQEKPESKAAVEEPVEKPKEQATKKPAKPASGRPRRARKEADN